MVYLIASTAFASNVIYLHPSLGTDRHYTSVRGYYSNVDSWYRTRYEAEYFPQNTTAPRYDYSYPMIDFPSRRQDYNAPYVFPYYLPYESDQSRYPGCNRTDLRIGSQIWASCNALHWAEGSDSRSGWFFYGSRYPTYQSINGINNTLEWKGRNLQGDEWVV